MSASDREEWAPKEGGKTGQRAARSSPKEGPRDREKAHDRPEPAPPKEASPAKEPAVPAEGAENKWLTLAQKNAWIAVPLLVPVAVVIGLLQGAQAVLLLLIGAMLVAVISLFWNSIRTLIGETPLTGADAYALAAPRAEEEQKQAVLRALKDLEFERSVGKISDDDYNALVAKYRAEAKRLLRSIEEEARPRRESVEWLVHQRLAKVGLAPRIDTFAYRSGPAEVTAKPSAPTDAKKDKKKKMKGADKPVVPPREVEIVPEEKPETAKPHVDVTLKSEAVTRTKESPAYVPSTKTCASCGVKNDPDANFCKKCGSKDFEGAASEAKPSSEPAKSDDEASSEEEAANDEAAENEADLDKEAKR